MDLKCGYFTFLVTVLVKYATAEFYSSIVGMESLLETEEAVIKNLNSYILEQKSRLIEFEKTLQRYNDEHNKAKEDFQRFLGIPLNSFLLTKRLTADLEDLIKKVEIDIDFLKNINQTKEQYTFPSKHDLMGAALAITRLQDSYDLKTVDLVNGVINGIDYGIKLTISDCLTISKEMIRTEYYYFAEQWLLESLKMVESEENINTSPIPILENLAKLAHMKNNLTLARDYTEKILQLDSNNKNGLELLEVITEITSSVDYTEVPETPFERTDEDPKYSPACKGELVKSPQELSKLKCYYSSVDSYFLKIAPIKVEQANINPPIVVFHDIVSDKEIELIQKLAIPKVKFKILLLGLWFVYKSRSN